MGKENLKNIFGEFGDFSPELEEMFGEIYLDQPDKSRDQVSEELQGKVLNIGPLIDAAIEHSPIIDCKENQARILNFLNGYIRGENAVTHDEWWGVMKHIDNCHETLCNRLYKIACQDKYLTPEAMLEDYGEEIKNWTIK